MPNTLSKEEFEELEKTRKEAFDSLTTENLQSLYDYYESSRNEMMQNQSQEGMLQAIYNIYAMQAVLLSKAINSTSEAAKDFYKDHENDFERLDNERKGFLQMHQDTIESIKELEEPDAQSEHEGESTMHDVGLRRRDSRSVADDDLQSVASSSMSRSLSGPVILDPPMLSSEISDDKSVFSSVSEWRSQVRPPRDAYLKMDQYLLSGDDHFYGEVKVFSVPGGNKGYLDKVIDEHSLDLSTGGKLSQDKYQEFVGLISKVMEADFKRGVLKTIEPEPTRDNVSIYNINGKTLTEIENPNGTISFKPEDGLNGVVRVQRKDGNGDLIEAYDTIEYQNGKVSKLVVGGEGISRLGDIGIPKERGVLVSGAMTPEEQRHFSSMSESVEAKRTPGLPHFDAVLGTSQHATSHIERPPQTPRAIPHDIRVLKPGNHRR